MTRGADGDDVLYWLTFYVACFDEPDPDIWARVPWIEATYWRGEAISRSPLAAVAPLFTRPLACVLRLAWRYVDDDPQGQESSLDACLTHVRGIRFWSAVDARGWGPGSVLPYDTRWELVDADALARAVAEDSSLARQLDEILRGPANPPFYAGY